MSLQWNGAGMEMQHLPLRVFIAFASGVQPWLVSGLPDWAETTRWNMSAKIVDADAKLMNSLTLEQRRTLMLSALQERFGMVTHYDQKMQPVFLLTSARNGPKFKPTPALAAGVPVPAFGRTRWTLENGTLQGTAVSMPQLAEQLANSLDRNVVDRTGLVGEFDLKLRLPERETTNPADGGSDAAPPETLFEAVKEQLGLRISSGKAPVPTLIVDKLTQPEAN
jgi:uncharacterized protein (TIGR03435 family)